MKIIFQDLEFITILKKYKNEDLNARIDFYSDNNNNELGSDDIYIYLINLKDNNNQYGKYSEKFLNK